MISFLRAYGKAGIAFLGLYALLALPVFAQGQDWNFRVVEVEVSGNKVATSSLILGVCAIEKGSPINPTQVQETIRRLYGLGMFSDARIIAEPAVGGIKVVIQVKELPKLIDLTFSGNKEIKSKTLKEKLKLGVGGYISPFLVAQKQEEIRQLYNEKGYFRAEIKPEVTYNADSSEANVKFTVHERSKIKVREVILTGNVRVKSNSLIKVMRNRKRGFLKSSTFAKDKYEEDLEKVIAEYHKKGYIDAYLVSDSIEIDTSSNCMTIRLAVYEGPQYYFGNTTYTGNEKIKSEMLDRTRKFKSGSIFNIEKYDESLTELYLAYQEIGHLNLRIDDNKTTRDDSVLDIKYDISEGLPSHIRLVNIVGNTKTKDRVIRRELSTMPGQVFNRSLLMRSIRDAMALNYFTKVEPAPVSLPNGDVDLEFKIEEKQTGQVSAGAGYNSQDKLVGNIGLGIPNLAGNGQNLNLSVEWGKNRNSVSVSFTEPWLFGRPTLLGTDLYNTNRRSIYDEYTEGRRGGSIRFGRRLHWPDNYFRAYASYRLEQNRFYDFTDYFGEKNASNIIYNTKHITEFVAEDSTVTTTSRTVIPFDTLPGSVLQYGEDWFSASQLSFTLTRDSRNLPEFATRGSQISYSIEKTGGLLGGYWNYTKHSISLAKFIPIIGKLALASRVNLSAVTSPKGDSRILLSDRFYPGGTAYDGVVRGYNDGSLTPDSAATLSADTMYYFTNRTTIDGADTTRTAVLDTVYADSRPTYRTTVRGKYLIVANMELQYPIVSQQFYGLLFFDAGNSWLHRENIRPISGLYKSVGVGFRLVVPGIGTIGFDFGFPLDEKLGQEKKMKAHFQIGTTFR